MADVKDILGISTSNIINEINIKTEENNNTIKKKKSQEKIKRPGKKKIK